MFGVFTFTLTHFLAKSIFLEGMGLYKIVVEIPEGWGVILVAKNGNSGEEVGALRSNSLCGGGMDIFWNYTFTAIPQIRYCAKVTQAKCANFVLCSRELSSDNLRPLSEISL